MDEATGLYDYGARWYDPAVERWGQVDPLAEPYAPISPYVYVANNPILLIDQDGRHIDIGYIDGQGETQYYRYGSGEEITNSFVQTVVNTLDKTVADGLDVEGVITTLANDNSATFINETTWDDHNNSSPAKGGGSVNWSPEGGIVTDNGDNRSPAVGLLHELGHILFETFNPEGLTGEPNYSDYPIVAEGDAAFNRDFNAYEQQQIEASGHYDNPSDKWVIQKVENPASSRLGQPTRNTHSYQRKYQAAGPFSTKEKMINKSILIICLTLFFTLNLLGQEICRLDFYALPWSFNIEGQLTDSLVRHYEGYTKTTSIDDSLLIAEFSTVTSLPTLYPDKISKRRFVPKVVIDVWIKYPQKVGGKIPFRRVIMLNEQKHILYEGIRYHRSDLLITWLEFNQIID